MTAERLLPGVADRSEFIERFRKTRARRNDDETILYMWHQLPYQLQAAAVGQPPYGRRAAAYS